MFARCLRSIVGAREQPLSRRAGDCSKAVGDGARLANGTKAAVPQLSAITSGDGRDVTRRAGTATSETSNAVTAGEGAICHTFEVSDVLSTVCRNTEWVRAGLARGPRCAASVGTEGSHHARDATSWMVGGVGVVATVAADRPVARFAQ